MILATHKKTQLFPFLHAGFPYKGLGINFSGLDQRLKFGFADWTHLTVIFSIV